MSVRCPQCGAENNTAKFCAHCGTPLAQAAPPQPPVHPYTPTFPQQPPQRKGTPGWVWGAVGGGLALLLIAGAVIFMVTRDKDTPAVVKPPTSGQPATKQPAAATSKVALTPVAKGKLAGGARGQYYAAHGKYLAEGSNNIASFYQFDTKGNAMKINEVADPEAGQLLDVSIGDMLNKGTPVMVATYEQKVYVAAPTGKPQAVPGTGTERVLMGDYDGDGKVESVFLGERGFNVYRYAEGGDNRPIYGKKDAVNPFPLVWGTQQKAGDRQLMYGYTLEGSDLFALLYKWDGLSGPVEIGRYKLSTPDQTMWLASAPSHLGPTFAAVRENPTTVEFLTLSSDAKTANSLGSLPLEGVEWPAVVMSPFTGQKAQLLAIDGAGQYVLYDIAQK